MATPTTATPSGSPSTPDQPFDTVLRGYERRQVDDYVGRLKDEITQLKDNLAEAQRKRRLANEHAEATEREMRDLRAKSAHWSRGRWKTASGTGRRSCCASRSRRPQRV